MSDKIEINPDQVIARKGGFISYADDNGVLQRVKEASVTVRGEAAAGSAPVSASSPPKEKAPFPVDIPQADAVPIQPPLDAPPSKPTKPAKGKKETADMASKGKAKKTAGKKKAAKAPGGVRTISGKAVDLSRYVKSKAPGGGTSYHADDDVGRKLAGKELKDVYDIVAKALGVTAQSLKTKYGKLNVGMQRMNLGNRYRKALKAK